MKISPTGKGSVQYGTKKYAQYDNGVDPEFRRIDESVANEARQMNERTQMVEGFVDVMKNSIRELQYDYPFLTTEDVTYILQKTLESLQTGA